jgi:hypothetical protein
LTTPQPDEQGKTAPIELPAPPATPPPAKTAPPDGEHPQGLAAETLPATRSNSDASSVVARPATPLQQEVMYVPLAVTIGDGFKFGCGFFLASVVVMLIGFVLLAALFVLTTVFGLNLPIGR